MCRIQVLKRGRWDFFSALESGRPFFSSASHSHRDRCLGIPRYQTLRQDCRIWHLSLVYMSTTNLCPELGQWFNVLTMEIHIPHRPRNYHDYQILLQLQFQLQSLLHSLEGYSHTSAEVLNYRHWQTGRIKPFTFFLIAASPGINKASLECKRSYPRVYHGYTNYHSSSFSILILCLISESTLLKTATSTSIEHCLSL